MKINREKIHKCVIESLKEVLDKPIVVEINDQTDPIRNLGLESEDGVEFACALSEKLDYHIPDDLNPFTVDIPRERSRKVFEIVDLICDLLTKEKEPANARN